MSLKFTIKSTKLVYLMGTMATKQIHWGNVDKILDQYLEGRFGERISIYSKLGEVRQGFFKVTLEKDPDNATFKEIKRIEEELRKLPMTNQVYYRYWMPWLFGTKDKGYHSVVINEMPIAEVIDWLQENVDVNDYQIATFYSEDWTLLLRHNNDAVQFKLRFSEEKA